MACWIDGGRKVHITPLLAVGNDRHFCEPDPDDDELSSKHVDRYPKVKATAMLSC